MEASLGQNCHVPPPVKRSVPVFKKAEEWDPDHIASMAARHALLGIPRKERIAEVQSHYLLDGMAGSMYRCAYDAANQVMGQVTRAALREVYQ
jgi:hypothetical protein